MLIRCPTCASGYELAPELLPDGRILRCAHCRDAWVHGAEGDGPRFAPALAEERRFAPALAEERRFAPALAEERRFAPALAEERRFAPALAEERRFAPPGAQGPEIVAETRFSRRAEPETAPPRRPRARPRASARTGLPAWAGSAASLALALLIVGGGMGAVAAKARLVEAFPPSAAVFAVLGLPVNLTGLGLGAMRSIVVSGDGGSTLTLEGHITNLRPAPVAVPPLRIAVRDKSRRELYYWTAPAPKAQLAVGETVLFRSRLAAPPRDGQDLAVTFAEPSVGPRRGAEVLAGR